MRIFDSTLKGLGKAFNDAAGQRSDELQQEKSINAVRKAMAAVQGREVSDIPSAAALHKNSAPISAGILQERAEQERLAAERCVVIDCESINALELLVKNGKKGPLLDALDADKEVILVNFQKVQAGTDSHLQSFLDFINGNQTTYSACLPCDDSLKGIAQLYTQADIQPYFKITIPLFSMGEKPLSQDDLSWLNKIKSKRLFFKPA